VKLSCKRIWVTILTFRDHVTLATDHFYHRMVVPSVRLSTVANRAFPLVGPQIWNDLPAEVTSGESLTTFRQRLKTHLFFQNHFPVISWTLTNFTGH